MQPLGFSLKEMKQLLKVREKLETAERFASELQGDLRERNRSRAASQG